MAIAASPSDVHPQRVREARSRPVAMSAHYLPRGPVRVPGDAPPEQEGLLATALGLSERARSWPGMAHPARREWALMGAWDDVEAWVIAWPPGGAIELHDHGGSAGAVVVAVGELLETSIVSLPFGGVAAQTNTVRAGGSIQFAGHHVHDIINVGEIPAISVHVYAPRLRKMTYYKMHEGDIEPAATVHYAFGKAMP